MTRDAFATGAAGLGTCVSSARAAADPQPAAERDDVFRRRAPCLAICLALAAGILADAHVPLDFGVWWCSAAAAAVAWLIARALRRDQLGAACLCVAALGLGAARHHLYCRVRPPDSLLRYLRDTPQPVQLSGSVRTLPQVRRRATPTHWHGAYELRFGLECTALETDMRSCPARGTVQVVVSMDASVETRLGRGELLWEPGTPVSIYGKLHRPRGRSNPGGFDYEEDLRSRGIDAVLYVSDEAYLSLGLEPDAVSAASPETIGLAAWLGTTSGQCLRSVRAATARALRSELSGPSRAVATALLLGDRTQLDSELSDAFVASGTMHLLSISGLHVGLFAVLLATLCRVAQCSLWTTSLVVAGGVLAYAGLADVRPPIIRAVTLVLVWCAGMPWFRSPCPLNTLALAAIVILFRNPTDLFDPGAQLSFLALLGILSRDALFRYGPDIGQVHARELREQSRWHDGLHSLWGHLQQQLTVMVSIWLWTMPLQAAVFHVVSPIGILCNLILIPLLTPILGCGFLFIVCAAGPEPLLNTAGWMFDHSLRGLLSLVWLAARVPGGHFSLPTPATWWLVGHYVVMFVMVRNACRRSLRWIVILAWFVVGLGAGLWPQTDEVLRCTALDVGHGCAILIEFPNGRTLLYDAGAMTGGERAFRTVAGAMHEFGHVGIDALVISHADVDHCNAVPQLLSHNAIGVLLVSSQFLDVEEAIVEQVLEAAWQSGTPVRLVERGDLIVLDERVPVRVRHPDRAFQGVSDNSDSLVLDVEFATQHVLLTGDLEDDGLQALLAHAPGRVLMMLVPHHGSQNVRHRALAEWCRPEWGIVSAGQRLAWTALHEQYGATTRLLWTRYAGAVTFNVHPGGHVHVQTHHVPVDR